MDNPFVVHSRRMIMRTLDTLALVLLIVGGLNWGLVGAFDFDLVATLFGEMSALSRIVYVLVGLSAVVVAARLRNFIGTGAVARV